MLSLKKKCCRLTASWWNLTSGRHQAASTTQRSARPSCSARNGSRLPARLHREAVSLPRSIVFCILAGMPAETVVVVCIMEPRRFLDPQTSTLRDMLRLLARQRIRPWSSASWSRVASTIHRLLSFGRKPGTVGSTRHILVGLKETAVVVIYIYTYIYIYMYKHVYTYTYVFTHSLHVYVYILTYIHRESTRVCVKISVYAPSVHIYVYLFVFMYTEFKHTCGCVCIYV